VTDAPKGLPVSVQVRLVQHAKATGIDPNVVLARYAAERFLYRLSRSRRTSGSRVRSWHRGLVLSVTQLKIIDTND
jgi:hypothetical protein